MDDHPDLRDLGGPVPYMEVRPYRDQLYKTLSGFISLATLVLLVLAVPVAVLLYRAAF